MPVQLVGLQPVQVEVAGAAVALWVSVASLVAGQAMEPAKRQVYKWGKFVAFGTKNANNSYERCARKAISLWMVLPFLLGKLYKRCLYFPTLLEWHRDTTYSCCE